MSTDVQAKASDIEKSDDKLSKMIEEAARKNYHAMEGVFDHYVTQDDSVVSFKATDCYACEKIKQYRGEG